MREVWIVKGSISNLDGYEDENKIRSLYGLPLLREGDVEYQFSDGPPGERGSSSDYSNLDQGLAAHSGYIIHWNG